MNTYNEVCLGGVWITSDKASISTQDRGFLLGDGCFETLRFWNGRIEGMEAHLSLLQTSLNVLSIDMGKRLDDVKKSLSDMQSRLSQNDVTEAIVRITVSRGLGRGAIATGSPNWVIQADCNWGGRQPSPITIRTSSIRRNETSPLSRIKAGCYGDHLAALREAMAAGYNDALMLNMKGDVAGLSMSNIVKIENRSVAYIRAENGVRHGYMMPRFIKFLEDEGYRAEEADGNVNEYLKSTASYYSLNSLSGARPISKIDHMELDVQSNLANRFNCAGEQS